jgi:group I intron endonuclease
MASIYKIVQIGTDRCYVGQTIDWKSRKYSHRRALRAGTHRSRFLQRAWDKYGESAFEFVEIENCSLEQMVAREQYWMDELNSVFNVQPAADSSLGVKRSEEFKENMKGNKRGKNNKGNPSVSRDRLAKQKQDPKFLEACRIARAAKIKQNEEIDAIMHPKSDRYTTARENNSLDRQYWYMFGDGSVLPAHRWRSKGHRETYRSRGLYIPRGLGKRRATKQTSE